MIFRNRIFTLFLLIINCFLLIIFALFLSYKTNPSYEYHASDESEIKEIIIDTPFYEF